MKKKFGHYGWIFLILFLYIFDFIMRDYSWVKLKYIMDIKLNLKQKVKKYSFDNKINNKFILKTNL